MEEQPQKSCTVCGVKSDLKCSVCKTAYYCGPEHQKSHWKVHKKECAKMKQQREEEEKKPVELECAVCGISESSAHLKLCANCQMIAYCGKECQLENWKIHRNMCAGAESTRLALSQGFANEPEFQGDSRFQQLEQDRLSGAKRRWLRHALELLFFCVESNIEVVCFGQFQLGVFYEYGYGVKQDFEKAMKWYRKAADQGDPDAQLNLGVCYAKGKGVPIDVSEAMKWYRKAADQGQIKAQCNLALCCEASSHNKNEAVKWYRKAADQGYAGAQCNLGLRYEQGKGVSKDLSEAVKWYRKAADQGVAGAQYNLALCYCNGKGVPKDMSKAVKWFRKAADQGDAQAQHNLGLIYFKGEGVLPNPFESIKWLQKAADQGIGNAIELLKKLKWPK